MSVCAWFVTWGDGRLFDSEPFTEFYDAQARAMLHCRLDVPPRAIGFEAFVRDGKSYGYFGIGPALLRLPLAAVFPAMDGRWSRSFILIACGINLVCAYRLLLRLRGNARPDNRAQKVMFSLFVLCAGIGSTTVFIASRAYTYHEAIIWGGAFALLFMDCLMRYLETPRLGLLAAVGIFAFLSFHSRATVGAGALLMLCVVALELFRRARLGGHVAKEPQCLQTHPPGRIFLGLNPIARPLSHAILAAFMILLTIGAYFAVNYARFRTFDGVPLRYYARYFGDSDHMQVTGGKQIHPENLGTGIASYFGLAAVQFGPEFPWVYMSKRPFILGSPAIDLVEPYSCVPLSMPALVLLVLAGVWPILAGRAEDLRRLRLPAIALLLGGATVLMTVGITERYLHDFYPFLIVAGAAGVCRLVAGANAGRIAAVLFVLAAISIAINCAFALEFQRTLVWGVPEQKRQELVHVRQAIDRLLHRTPVAAARE